MFTPSAAAGPHSPTLRGLLMGNSLGWLGALFFWSMTIRRREFVRGFALGVFVVLESVPAWEPLVSA